MALQPRPKTRSLQVHPKPRVVTTMQDPDEALARSKYNRAQISNSDGAMPSETFQYDIVYEAFCQDEAFKNHWKVKGCARNSKDESISQENATIRVVMDLPPSQRLYPTAYTPGFPTIPVDAEGASGKQLTTPERIPGLPVGYSVALDVHILEDSRIMLRHHCAKRDKVDPEYEWLYDIVKKVDEEEGVPISYQPSLQTSRSAQLVTPEEAVRPLPGSSGSFKAKPKESLSSGLQSFSDLYGDSVQMAEQNVQGDNLLISAFGRSAMLPPRESGSWTAAPKKSTEDHEQEMARSRQLDAQLASILEKTLSDEAEGDNADNIGAILPS